MGLINLDWPFPQIFRGKRRTILAERRDVHEIEESTFLPQYINIYDAYTNILEKITNGNFTGNANNWTLSGGWTYGSNKVSTTSGGILTQLSTSMVSPPVDGKWYYIKADVTITSGYIIPMIGVEFGDVIVSSGSIIRKVKCSGGLNLSFVATGISGSINLSIDSVSLTEATGEIISGGPWQFIDLGDSWVLLNGATTVFTRGSLVYTENSITINAGCSHNGRVLFGGFDPDNFWNTAWTAYWASAITKASLTMGMFSNTVWWTGIGMGAANLHSLFYPTDVTGGNYPLFLDALQQNDAGFITMSWRGRVWALKPLGKGVVVYGDSGITYLNPIVDPSPTYGKVEISKTGITSPNAVGGDEKQHVFINSSGQLCILTADLQLKDIGYQEYMQMLVQDNTVVVTHDPVNREYNISNGKVGFCLNENGLYETTTAYTSIINISGVPCAIYDILIPEYNNVIGKTDAFTLGIPGEKLLTWVEVVYEGIDGLTIAGEYKSKGGGFITGPQKPVNNSGVARINLSGEVFRIALYGTRKDNLRISSITVKAQVRDKRYIRGIYADQSSS
jgi:hypothetical protein